MHTATLWSGGPTLGAVLDAAHLRTGTNLVAAMPDLPVLVTGALQGLLAGLSLPIGTLSIGISGDAGKLGAKLKGKLPIPIGDFELTLYLGQRPSGPLGDVDAGLTLNLFTLPGFAFQPQLKARGIGLGFSNKNDKPLVDTSIVRIGEVAALAYFNVNLFGGFSTSGWGFEAELARFGLPLGAASGSGGGGGNPVAASLMSSDGGGTGGDSTSVSPECDIGVRFMAPSDFSLTIGGESGALWLTIQKQFGPIYIEQIGIQTLENGKKVSVLLDGGVKIAAIAVQVDDLAIIIPITKLGDASQWGLDLKGMAVSMEAGTVKIAGGLLKNPGPPVSYDGALMVDVAGRGFTAIGSYAKPIDELGEYTSFFVFVSLPIPLGGPPYFFVLGLGGGVGINRALLVPTDMNQIPSFPLVAAIDNSSFANDPMGALRQMGTNIPPRRGGFWLAAGLKFSTFVVVNSTAVIYVALDHGFEVGLLGLSRMALPTEDFAIAQIELALLARFSTAEGLLSVQAQLTDRSYLFHPSCQLTGGFAFFLWFNTGKFVLTLGGYHKAFSKPPEFPDVPRLGFRWSVSDCVVIKGESYFALTTTCVMGGGRLEASFHGGPVKAWFKVYLDVLVSWDPFYYVFETGIEIGASVDTWLGEIGVSLGAMVHIEGPPLFGWVEVEIVVVTIRVEFGDPSHEIDYIDDFGVFRDKYLTTGDGRDNPVDVHLRAGLLPTNPPGADPAPGTADAPWVVGAEWAFESETRAPTNAMRWDDGDRSVDGEFDGAIDLAPMNRQEGDEPARAAGPPRQRQRGAARARPRPLHPDPARRQLPGSDLALAGPAQDAGGRRQHPPPRRRSRRRRRRDRQSQRAGADHRRRRRPSRVRAAVAVRPARLDLLRRPRRDRHRRDVARRPDGEVDDRRAPLRDRDAAVVARVRDGAQRGRRQAAERARPARPRHARVAGARRSADDRADDGSARPAGAGTVRERRRRRRCASMHRG